MQTSTKASQAELDVIKNNKIGIEELDNLKAQITELKEQILNLEGDEKHDDAESDSATPMTNSEKFKRQTRNMFGYGEELYAQIKQDMKFGKSIGLKKHLKYHQLQLNEI